MLIKNKRFIRNYFYALVFSFFGVLIATALYNISSSFNIDLSFGGDKGSIFFGIFIGMPIGNIFGVILAERRLRKLNILALFLIAIINLSGNVLALYIIDKIGGSIFPLLYLVIIFFGVATYSLIVDN